MLKVGIAWKWSGMESWNAGKGSQIRLDKAEKKVGS
jgi:hypothetical protein